MRSNPEIRVTTLEEYLSSSYLTNKQEIFALDKAIGAASRTFIATHSKNGWPYQLEFDKSVEPPKKMSVGTTAMVLTAIGRVLGKEAFGDKGVAVRFESESASEALLQTFDDGLKSLLVELSTAKKLESSTFGPDNSLTLSHMADLADYLGAGAKSAEAAAINVAAENAKSELKKALADPAHLSLETEFGAYQQNAFIPLRSVRAAKLFGEKLDLRGFRTFFETTLHEQLSFSAIPDSRFDPAELVFSLEGLLLCAEHAVDAAVMNRVIEVLGEKQNTSSHWRPNKPFIASASGMIVLPISVEVANSLMRSIATMDRGRAHDTYTSKALPLLRRFWSWLQARAVRGTDNQGDCIGWHSEHINVPDLVHIWDTSQVVEFMAAYRELLEREVSTTTLHLSGLVLKAPELHTDKATNQWDESTLTFDASPVDDGSGSLKFGADTVYRQIGEHFVKGWAEGKPKNFSMLLYGPPGTGKTSVAKELSKALQMSLITVTVSDFLGGGGTSVEARAKALFQTLEHQRNVIILFDEIDSFLLDRDSKFYREQDSLFQFLTPGMLPKLHDLHDAKASIFIIATNYENRIDPAIKRSGRIDRHYLVPLPNAAKRRAILVDKKVPREFVGNDIIEASVFLGYGDLVTAAKDWIAQTSGGPDKARGEALRAILKCAKPASSLRSYLNRVEANPADFAPAEFDDMMRLASEAGASEKISAASEFVATLKVKRDLRKDLSSATLEAMGDEPQTVAENAAPPEKRPE